MYKYSNEPNVFEAFETPWEGALVLGRMPFGGYYSYNYSRDLAARFLRLVTSLTSTDDSIKLLDITYKLTATSRTPHFGACELPTCFLTGRAADSATRLTAHPGSRSLAT